MALHTALIFPAEVINRISLHPFSAMAAIAILMSLNRMRNSLSNGDGCNSRGFQNFRRLNQSKGACDEKDENSCHNGQLSRICLSH